ncbi:MAG: chorismate mutase [Omnitrophica WOR_2 bacterium GWA2_47_8]|nr:MAG: chorismate mutase [Omnitrophica WOR_2 bacterium GWA2_47_8]
MSLKKLRKKIDGLDSQLVGILNARAQISQYIGKEKSKIRKGIYSPEREKEVLGKIRSLNKGPLTHEALEAIYREIMSCSLSLEKIKEVACLGQDGSFTYSAAKKKFGSQVKYRSCASIQEVFMRVERGECAYGVVPIENSTEGGVTHTLDLFVDSDLRICSQTLYPISHNLISKYPKGKIKVIYSNPQVFGQCRNWLLENFPQVPEMWVASTTEAVQKASKAKNAAAIASTRAAEIFHMPVIEENIQDTKHNTTRFFVIGHQDAAPTGKDKTSILFSIKDRVGALHAMLVPFYKNRINLTKIESRPSKRKAWDYFFFVDFEGHRLDKNVKQALSKLEDMCKYLKILGSYPI